MSVRNNEHQRIDDVSTAPVSRNILSPYTGYKIYSSNLFIKIYYLRVYVTVQ